MKIFYQNDFFFFILTGATWYYYDIYIVFTYLSSFTGYEDEIFVAESRGYLQPLYTSRYFGKSKVLQFFLAKQMLDKICHKIECLNWQVVSVRGLLYKTSPCLVLWCEYFTSNWQKHRVLTGSISMNLTKGTESQDPRYLNNPELHFNVFCQWQILSKK